MDTKHRRFSRGLRPLWWWLGLVAVLFALHTHEKLLQQTRLHFTASLAGHTFLSEPVAMLDGKVASSGQLISLGNHQLVFKHPKGETFTTNLFVWYGKRDLGRIDLKRAKGKLSITVNPPAPRLSISGPEFRITLTNTSGFSSDVPTDEYTVEAQYRHWQKRDMVTVWNGVPSTFTIAPKIGALQLSCNQDDATFQLVNQDTELTLEVGKFPAAIVELPEGSYKLLAMHHNHQWTEYPTVTAGTTNLVNVEFKYGAAVLETKPAGATVTSGGKNWGVTPLTLTELQPAIWNFNLQLDNYEPVTAEVKITANETARFQTNLTSLAYTAAMRSAREHLAAAQYMQAVEALTEALRVQPDDPIATALQHQADGLWHIEQAEAQAKVGDYIAGEAELKVALVMLPENEQINKLLADYRTRIPEQRERLRLERLARPKVLFDSILATMPDTGLFESHDLESPKPYKDLQLAIYNAFQGEPPAGQPKFKITRYDAPKPETFRIEVVQEFSTVLATSTGKRICVIVGGQTKDDETQILFKVLEYKTKHNVTMPGLLAFRDDVEFVAIHPSKMEVTEALKLRMQEGVQIFSERVRRVLGE